MNKMMNTANNVLSYCLQWVGKGVNPANECLIATKYHAEIGADYYVIWLKGVPHELVCPMGRTDDWMFFAARILRLGKPIAKPIEWEKTLSCGIVPVWEAVIGSGEYQVYTSYRVGKSEYVDVTFTVFDECGNECIFPIGEFATPEEGFKACQDHLQAQYDKIGGWA